MTPVLGGVRRPAAAGTFYPAYPDDLAAAVDALLEAAGAPSIEPGALIVPHAGYVYSGPVAAPAYRGLATVASRVRRVVLFGPAHFALLGGCAVPACDAWATPLGEVAIDPGLRELAAGRGAAVEDGPHESEHSLEVQLPFLQRVLGPRFSLLPVAVGYANASDVADLIDVLWDGPETFVLVSTDLSHYHDHETAIRRDRRTADAVVARQPVAIGPDDACGVFALRGIVEHARRNGLGVTLLDLRTSADTAGDPSRVVGYGAFALHAP